MNDLKLTSPLIEGGAVKLLTTIKTKNLNTLYKVRFRIDIERFFEGLEEVEIYQCTTTGYIFAYPFSVAGDGKFYEDLQKYEWYYRADKWEHLESLKYISKGDSVLEVGCAKGAFLERLKAHGANVVGLELNEDAVEKASAKGLDVKNQLVQEFARSNTEKFDVVCSYQVLEHITEVGVVIDAMIKCLRPGGKLIISVPNNESQLPIDNMNAPPHHVGFWDTNSFTQLQYNFPIKLIEINYEPEQLKYANPYSDSKYRQPLNGFGYSLYKLLSFVLPGKEKVLRTLSSTVMAHCIMPVYEKQ